MSKKITKSKSFLDLLIFTTTSQARALLDTVTDEQTLALCEIAFNLQTLPLSGIIQKKIKLRKSLLKKLSDSKIKIKTKTNLIRAHKYQILDILYAVRFQLKPLL